jgi:hypothetical protein
MIGLPGWMHARSRVNDGLPFCNLLVSMLKKKSGGLLLVLLWRVETACFFVSHEERRRKVF